MNSTLLVLRQRKRTCRVQYESVEFVVAGCRQTAMNAKMSRDEADLTDITVLKNTKPRICLGLQIKQ